MRDMVLVLDFGGAYKELAAKSVRALGVYSEVKSGRLTAAEVKAAKPVGIIMAGGTSKSEVDRGIFALGLPVLTVACPQNLQDDSAQNLSKVEFAKRGDAAVDEFLTRCGAKRDYKLEDYIEAQIDAIKKQVGSEKVLLGLSGGVDSSVCAELISRAVPNRLVCIFVDTGLMRHNEGNEVEEHFCKRTQFIRVNAQDRFLARLAGVTDPEKKRKIIGEEFVNIFTEEAEKLGSDVTYLAQGTIYPDVIESGLDGNFVKSHHNVGGLPETLKFKGLVEPLRTLFKGEVRSIGRLLGLPPVLSERQPFPGPGLAVRVLGEVTEQKLSVLRLADKVVREELSALKNPPTQYFAALTGLKAVGIKKGKRVYDHVIAVRAIDTTDFMQAKVRRLPYGVLARIAKRITKECGAARVLYDITDKPPATIEYE